MKNSKTPENPSLKQKEIIHIFLKNVPFDGWNQETFLKSVAQSQMDEHECDALFPNGLTSLIELWAQDINEHMCEEIEKQDQKNMGVRERIFQALKIRFLLLQNHEEACRKALSFLSHPCHPFLFLKLTTQTVDTIWTKCGDTSTDYNWYTKRFLLAGIYSSTFIYWLNDRSQDKSSTWLFLKQQIDRTMMIAKIKTKLKHTFGRLT